MTEANLLPSALGLDYRNFNTSTWDNYLADIKAWEENPHPLLEVPQHDVVPEHNTTSKGENIYVGIASIPEDVDWSRLLQSLDLGAAHWSERSSDGWRVHWSLTACIRGLDLALKQQNLESWKEYFERIGNEPFKPNEAAQAEPADDTDEPGRPERISAHAVLQDNEARDVAGYDTVLAAAVANLQEASCLSSELSAVQCVDDELEDGIDNASEASTVRLSSRTSMHVSAGIDIEDAELIENDSQLRHQAYVRLHVTDIKDNIPSLDDITASQAGVERDDFLEVESSHRSTPSKYGGTEPWQAIYSSAIGSEEPHPRQYLHAEPFSSLQISRKSISPVYEDSESEGSEDSSPMADNAIFESHLSGLKDGFQSTEHEPYSGSLDIKHPDGDGQGFGEKMQETCSGCELRGEQLPLGNGSDTSLEETKQSAHPAHVDLGTSPTTDWASSCNSGSSTTSPRSQTIHHPTSGPSPKHRDLSTSNRGIASRYRNLHSGIPEYLGDPSIALSPAREEPQLIGSPIKHVLKKSERRRLERSLRDFRRKMEKSGDDEEKDRLQSRYEALSERLRRGQRFGQPNADSAESAVRIPVVGLPVVKAADTRLQFKEEGHKEVRVSEVDTRVSPLQDENLPTFKSSSLKRYEQLLREGGRRRESYRPPSPESESDEEVSSGMSHENPSCSEVSAVRLALDTSKQLALESDTGEHRPSVSFEDVVVSKKPTARQSLPGSGCNPGPLSSEYEPHVDKELVMSSLDLKLDLAGSGFLGTMSAKHPTSEGTAGKSRDYGLSEANYDQKASTEEDSLTKARKISMKQSLWCKDTRQKSLEADRDAMLGIDLAGQSATTLEPAELAETNFSPGKGKASNKPSEDDVDPASVPLPADDQIVADKRKGVCSFSHLVSGFNGSWKFCAAISTSTLHAKGVCSAQFYKNIPGSSGEHLRSIHDVANRPHRSRSCFGGCFSSVRRSIARKASQIKKSLRGALVRKVD
ncbi:hypothetical protein MMC09_000672 [Bachmanniomyces sp. S44760]|nr:hypothetical protein [Bachmanniomyces sp. S44760]